MKRTGLSRLTGVSAWALACLALAASGCGGKARSANDSAPGVGATQPVAPEHYVERLAELSCRRLASCGQAFSYADKACVEGITPILADELGELVSRVENGTVVYDAAVVGGCFAAAEQAPCIQDGRDLLGCPEGLHGTLKLGSPCNHDLECVPEAYCRPSAQCPGECVARCKLGEKCVTETGCASGLTGSGSGVCQSLVGEGKSCGEAALSRCKAGLTCVGTSADGKVSGVCKGTSSRQTQSEGEACGLDGSLACKSGLVCAWTGIDAATNRLTSQCEQPAKPAGRCHLATPEQCPAGQYCNADLQKNQFEGECRPYGTSGASCATGSAGVVRCGIGLACTGEVQAGRVCRPLARLEEGCSADPDCASGHCTLGVCASGIGCD